MLVNMLVRDPRKTVKHVWFDFYEETKEGV